MTDDPLFKFLQSVTEKIKVEKDHKALMEKIDGNTVVEPKEDPLLSAINVLKQKIVEVKQPITSEVIADKAENVEGTIEPIPEAIEEKDNFGDFLSKLKDIITGDKPKDISPTVATETPAPVVQEQESIEPKTEESKPDAVDIKNDYVDVLDKLSNEVAVEKEPQKISEIKKLIEQYAEKYFKKAAVMSEYAGGGGTNAVQYVNGGTMNGDLNVNANYLSGGVNLLDIFVTSETDSQTLSFNESNAQLSISNGNTVSLSALSGGGSGPADRLVNGSYQVVLSSDGQLNVPGAIVTASNSKLDLVGFGPNTAYLTTTPDDSTALFMGAAVAELRASTYVSITTNTAGTPYLWEFGADGGLKFPDNSTQTIAFTGNPDSSNWDSTYTTVKDTSGYWSQAYTNLTSNSAAYLSGVDISLLVAASSSWNSNYTTTNSNSAYWADTRYNVTFGQDVTINGNLTALGSSTFKNTIFTTTSALSVVNLGPGPALYVFQAAGASDVASFYDGDGIEVLHVGNAQGGGNPLGQVGINTSDPSAELTVNGAISANKDITVSGGNSNQWNSNYSTTQSNSASWSSAYTTLCSTSAFRVSNTITSVLFPNGYAFSSADTGKTYHVDTRSAPVSVLLPSNIPNDFSVTLITLGTNNMHVSSSQVPMLCATGTKVNLAFASTFIYKYDNLLWGLGSLI